MFCQGFVNLSQAGSGARHHRFAAADLVGYMPGADFSASALPVTVDIHNIQSLLQHWHGLVMGLLVF